MTSKFWAFVEACDEAHSPRAVKDLLNENLRALGFESYALTTHLPPSELRSLGVLVHNWSPEAIDHLYARRPERFANPIFEGAERTTNILDWSSNTWRSSLQKDQRLWLDRFRELVGGHGVTKGMRSMLVAASCSVTAPGPLHPDLLRLWMRIANYAYQHIQVLQRPLLSETDRLTAREHEVLYRAALGGERPSAVARGLGVKVSTVRTLRQKAYGRLDASSPEEAVWRMVETGQLFRRGRKSKPRST